MPTSTVKTEHVQITEAHVGRVYVERYETELAFTLKDTKLVRSATVAHTVRHAILAVKPADSSYYRNFPNAGPTVEVILTRILPDGVDRLYANAKGASRWFPTTGNAKTVEIEVAE